MTFTQEERNLLILSDAAEDSTDDSGVLGWQMARVLEHMRQGVEYRVMEIARAIGRSPSSIGGTIHNLANAGYIRKVRRGFYVRTRRRVIRHPRARGIGPTQQAMLDRLDGDTCSAGELAASVGQTTGAVWSSIAGLLARGHIVRVARGIYRRAEG